GGRALARATGRRGERGASQAASSTSATAGCEGRSTDHCLCRVHADEGISRRVADVLAVDMTKVQRCRIHKLRRGHAQIKTLIKTLRPPKSEPKAVSSNLPPIQTFN
ncbi:MAG: hypothetical protein ACK53K_04430, partial [Burkholderiales bacterium]